MSGNGNKSNIGKAKKQSGGNFTVMTDAEAQTLRDNMGAYYTGSVNDAIKQYISNTDAGQGYSKSQWLNYKNENGMTLNANEKFMDKYLQQGMHDLGKDTILNRACHSDMLEALGIKNYQNMSESQLNSALKGASFTTKSFSSTSYDVAKNPFISGSQSGGREIYMNIKAKASTKVLFGAKSQSEIILNKGTNMRITGVRFDGTYATPRGSYGSIKRLIVDVETY